MGLRVGPGFRIVWVRVWSGRGGGYGVEVAVKVGEGVQGLGLQGPGF